MKLQQKLVLGFSVFSLLVSLFALIQSIRTYQESLEAYNKTFTNYNKTGRWYYDPCAAQDATGRCIEGRSAR